MESDSNSSIKTDKSINKKRKRHRSLTTINKELDHLYKVGNIQEKKINNILERLNNIEDMFNRYDKPVINNNKRARTSENLVDKLSESFKRL